MTLRSFLLTDWTTPTGSAAIVGITQDPNQWLDLNGCADATLWIDVAALTTMGTVVLNLESSPTMDESLFALAAPPITLAASSTPLVIKTVNAVSATGLSRFLRWRITTTGGGAWTATFRIRVMANRSRYFLPTQVQGLSLWLRSDLGVTTAAGSVTSWADQSGLGNDALAGAATPTYNLTGGTNGLPRLTNVANGYMVGTLPSITTHTLFAVANYPALANRAAFAGTNGANGVNSGFAQFTETPTGIIGRTASAAGPFVSAVTTTTTSLGSTGIYSTAADSNNVDIYANGVLLATTATAFTLFSCTKYILLALGLPIAGAYDFTGDVYEFILFNSVLSANDRLSVHRYLGARYGIAVP